MLKERKWHVTGLLLLAFAIFWCAGAQAAMIPSVPAGELEEDAGQVVSDMLAGDFAAVTGRFDEIMAQSLDEASLKAAWDSVVPFLGEHVGTASITSEEADGNRVCYVTEEFENSCLLVQVGYNAEGQISGLYLRPVAAEQDTGAAGTPSGDSQQETTETGETGEETGAETEMTQQQEADGTTDDTERAEEPEHTETEYTETELTIVSDEKYPLGATLTLPAGAEKPPVVILVQGSGSSNRDEQLGGNRPFADLAQGLAERGIASLRYDKRFYTYPEGAAELSALNLRSECLDDVGAAIALMESDERVDGNHVFVLGHSLGGALTPAIAAEHPELAGIISMAGTLRPLWEISYDQNQEVIASLDEASLTEDERKLLESQIAQLEADVAILRSDALEEQADETMLLGMQAAYWKSIREYCGMNFINDVEMPVLVLQGDADFQVFPETDYALWQETLDGKENAVFRLYEGLNHLFMVTQGKRDVSEYETAGHVDSQVIDDIAAFISGKR